MTTNSTPSVDVVEERIRSIELEPLPRNVPEILEEVALDAPDRVALNFFEDKVSFTYAELRARVDAVARGLLRVGVKRDTKIGVMLPNGPEFPITWLAIARIGATMIPTNIDYTSRELDFVWSNADVEWACAHYSCLPSVFGMSQSMQSRLGQRIIVVGNDGPLERGMSFENLLDPAEDDVALPSLSEIAPDDVLNIQYTSGTTGMPKGCMLTQRYWVTSGKVNARRDGVEYRNILASVPFFYMDPQWLMLMAFFQRATLHVARRQSSSRFLKWLRDYKINFALFPEIVYKVPETPQDADNEIIRVNVYGLSKDTHADIERRFGFKAREAFGMTEIGSGMFMPLEATHMVGSGSCGRPSPFREARIVDGQGNELGDGKEGELQIRGPGILLGYYNNPEATRAAFMDGWFRTGDLARRDTEGYYYLVGRLKDMIRRAGENIAANEVESVLRAMPQVLEAAAVPEPDPIRDEEVKVFIALKEGYSPESVPPEAILEYARGLLARFKLPRYVAYVGEIPKTPSGKIAKHLLLKTQESQPSPVYDCTDGSWHQPNASGSEAPGVTT
ncbi:class I adenylate-forming enzyme family protein [Bradyrhizobium sp. DASA03007]|uniref:class I adenylate-forming enzyme family protein n=1 Tax=unclassified Bradyrhizobium TaxID=2631580 RepID=UPI003F70AC9F